MDIIPQVDGKVTGVSPPSTKGDLTSLDTPPAYLSKVREDSAVIVSPTISQTDKDEAVHFFAKADEVVQKAAQNFRQAKKWERSNGTHHAKHISTDSGTSLHSKQSRQSTRAPSPPRSFPSTNKAAFQNKFTALDKSFPTSVLKDTCGTTGQKDDHLPCRNIIQNAVKGVEEVLPGPNGDEKMPASGSTHTILVKKKKSNRVSVKDIKWTPEAGFVVMDHSNAPTTSPPASLDSSPTKKASESVQCEVTVSYGLKAMNKNVADNKSDAGTLDINNIKELVGTTRETRDEPNPSFVPTVPRAGSLRSVKPASTNAQMPQLKKQRSKQKSGNHDDLKSIVNKAPRLDDPTEFPVLGSIAAKPTVHRRGTVTRAVPLISTASKSVQGSTKATTPTKEGTATDVSTQRLT